MKVDWFRLSGTDYYGDEAERLFAIAREHGFDWIGGDFTPWPCGGGPPRFIADAGVSGVSAAAQVSFDCAGDLLDFLHGASLNEPREPDATECYRRLAGYTTPPEAPGHGE